MRTHQSNQKSLTRPLPRYVVAQCYQISQRTFPHTQAKTNESREVVLLSNDKGQLQDGEVAWELQGAQLRSFVWEDHSAVLQRYFNHAAPQQTPARPAPSARLLPSNPLSIDRNQAPCAN